MNKQETEDLYILSLDQKLAPADEERLLTALREHPDWARSLLQHKTARELLRASSPATFGPYFTAKLIHKIQNTGVVIDRQLFGMFKKFQLAAVGVVVALLILNVALAEQGSWKSVLGIEEDATTPVEQQVPFDFYETLNNL
ncbi:hypothetical protein SAMN04488109_3341 [Chryseolinea serpens]|uniref:Uncharacterized protein n=1 Tax=Chryseolinea serpens TaxID=947013 RepID=A0A1M5RDU2_9BACT|nr:helix-turn-helix domain-containing protein [Chryseolinea serpens]SHH24497.1 hypothetical protein SAMN04488109_3341 [Chryseolinea serpens]